MPKVTWTFNDASLPDAKRFKSQTIIGMTSLTMAKVVLKDAGNYKVTLENENGQATFTVKLIVLGIYSLWFLKFRLNFEIIWAYFMIFSQCRGLKTFGAGNCNFSTDSYKFPIFRRGRLWVLKILILPLNFITMNIYF